MSTQRILVVDDDPLSREFLIEALADLGHDVQAVDGGKAALEHLAAQTELPDVVVTDLRMPEIDGLQLIAQIGEQWPELNVVLCTAHASLDGAVEAMRQGAADFLVKPVSQEALELVLDRLHHTRRLTQENDYLRDEISGGTDLIAEDPAMIELLRSARRVARSKGTILLTGESGTGKERIANLIHRSSERADEPFIRVNCAALSEQLLESELFGHERGSFTGAHQRHIGRFELADGGTLLLDEVGEVSPAMQAKLLRVLQEEEFERVGGTQTIRVNVRVIAATNRDLVGEVAEGNFREDLYYRLHVLPLHIPPLRERQEDIAPLALHFAERYARQNGVSNPIIGDECRRRLCAHKWPGNVRELENVMQRAVILGADGKISPEDLVFGPANNTSAGMPQQELNMSLENIEFAEAIANHRMSDVERVAILATLERTGGNKTEAARRLGLTARTLSNKMKIWRQAGLVA